MRRAALAAPALLAAGFAVTYLVGPWKEGPISDVPLYSSYADSFLHGHLPYRDVAFEYPPLAAPVIAVAGLAGGLDAYRVAFAGLMIATAAVVMVLCGSLAERTGGDRGRAMIAAAVAPLMLGALLRARFDLVPVALTLGALLLLCARRPRTAFAVLGVGVALKLYPLVIAPVALAWLVARGERRDAVDGALALAGVVLAAYALSFAMAPSGTADSLTYHVDRAVQVESTPAILLRALDSAGLGAATPDPGHRSDGLDHPAAGAVTSVFAAAMLLAVLALAYGMLRGPPPDARDLVLASLAATVAFACLGKVLSPQYLIWVVPLFALAVGWNARSTALLSGTALVLTLVEFPSHYDDVVHRVPWALALVAVRDALLLALVAVALSARRAPGAAPAGWSWRGRPAPPRSAPR